MLSLERALWWLRDCIFPLSQPLDEDQIEHERQRREQVTNQINESVNLLPSDKEQLRKYLDDLTALLDAEHDRRQSVESRLTSIIGLTSIAGTVIFSGILAQATGKVDTQSALLKWTLALGALYLILQICSALLAAVRGLSRRSYLTLMATDVIPSQVGAIATHLRTRLAQVAEVLEDHYRENNQKVTQMDVAHRAMKNFVVGLLVFALIAAYGAITQRSDTRPDDCDCTARGPAQMSLVHLLTIGPFPDADHTLDADAVSKCMRNGGLGQERISAQAWLILGSADKRELRAKRARIYGSNQGLAMARAIWVREKVLSRLPYFVPMNAIVSTTGPQKTGAAIPVTDLNNDRSVEVFLWVADKKDLPAAQHAWPIVCSGSDDGRSATAK